MDEKTLIIISMVTMIIGFTILIIFVEDYTPSSVTKIEEIEPTQATLRGIITDIHISDKAIFLKVNGERIEETSVILFTKEDVFVKVGDHVEITGTEEIYQGKKEIIAEQIMLR